MHAAWKAARRAAELSVKPVVDCLPNAMREEWAKAKAELVIASEQETLLGPKDLIGYSVDYEGKNLTCTGLRKWSSKDGYDRRLYIECEVDGNPKNGLMYFFIAGQTDFFHIPADSPYGTIYVHENIGYELLS